MKGGYKMNNKKGVSAVVATVLIIMITVAAVGIIWAAIIPMVRDNLNKGTACNDAMSDISLVTDGGYTCVNQTSGNVSLQIKKASNTKVTLVAIQALVFVGGNSQTFEVRSGLPQSNEYKTIFVGNTSYGTQNATKVKIAPVVTIGRTEETCDAVSEAPLPACI
jgi:flagellin-like protein